MTPHPGIAPSGRRAAAGSPIARLVIALTLLLTAVLSAVGPIGQPREARAETEWSAPRAVYIPESGQIISGWFLDLWRESGGAGVLGNPITPEFTRDDGVVLQYYQFGRLEYWPGGDPDGNQLVLGAVGADLRPAVVPRLPLGGTTGKAAQMTRVAMAWEPLLDCQVKEDSDTYLFVPETGHSIYDGFLSFWLNSGLQWYLGNPISEEYVVDEVHYQVFERGQLRWEAGGDIELVPVGEKLTEQHQLSQAPTDQGGIPTYDEALFVPPVPPTMDKIAVTADPNGERWIDIDLSAQYLRAYQGDLTVLETSISSGTPGWETPTGTFYIGRMLEVDDMAGTASGTTWSPTRCTSRTRGTPSTGPTGTTTSAPRCPTAASTCRWWTPSSSSAGRPSGLASRSTTRATGTRPEVQSPTSPPRSPDR
jgi:hypothetical protein